MRTDVPKEMSSPRAVVGFSFLAAMHWLTRRLRSRRQKKANITFLERTEHCEIKTPTCVPTLPERGDVYQRAGDEMGAMGRLV